MSELTEYLKDNWEAIIAIWGGIVLVARLIVKLTPTPKDDAFLAKIVGLLKQLGLFIPDEPKK